MSLDRDTATRLLFRERAKIHAYLWAIVRDAHLTEDLFQELAVLVLNRCSEINSEAHFNKWVRAAARFKALKTLRTTKHSIITLDDEILDLLEGEWQTYDATRPAQLIEALRLCVGKLTPHARQLVRLRYGEGLSSARIADQLQRKRNAVYVAIGRIHNNLRACIERWQASFQQSNPS